MAGVARVNPATLGWIRSEIEVTLENAQSHLADFHDNGHNGDVSPFRLLSGDLHQIVGTLQMMEIDGAALLAQEVETLADAFVAGQASPDPETTGLLDRGLTAITVYLDQLHKGLPDLPIKQIDVLNQLRAARGDSPLDRYDLFHPDLETFPPKQAKQKLAEAEYRQTARQLRKDYQRHLLAFLRDTADRDALKGLAATVDALAAIARFSAVNQLWWVAGAFLATLGADHDGTSLDSKRLLGRLDQQIKGLIESGESALIQETPEELIRRMLFEIGRCDEALPAVQEIRSAFDLDVLLTGEIAVDEDELAALPDQEQLARLSESVAGDLETAQDLLSAYFASSSGDGGSLEPLIGHVSSIRARAEEQSIEPIRQLAGELADIGHAIESGQSVSREDASLEMAAALLFIEESLKGEHTPDLDWKDEMEGKAERLRGIRLATVSVSDIAEGDRQVWSEEALGVSEFKHVITAVADEIHVNLKKTETALEAYVAAPNAEKLALVPQHLKQVQGVLQILGQHRIAELLGMAGDTAQQLVDGTLTPERRLTEALAVTVGSTEAFVRGLTHGQPKMNDMVDRAARDLEDAIDDHGLDRADPKDLADKISHYLGRWIDDNADYSALRLLRRNLRRISSLADRRDHLTLHQIADEINNLLDIVSDDPSLLTQEVSGTLQRSMDRLTELSNEVAAAKPEVVPLPVQVESAPIQDADIQSDILEVFIEEAEECLQAIDADLAAWQGRLDDGVDLSDLRRQFHTLKGSGRMVGAGSPAELAWIVEDLLNRVIAGKLEASARVRSFTERAAKTLASVLGGQPAQADGIDLEAWTAEAEQIASGEPEPATEFDDETAAAGEPTSVTAPTEVEAEAEVAGHPEPTADADRPAAEVGEPADAARTPRTEVRDATVRRIFTQETRQHLAVIGSVLSRCQKDADQCAVTENLLRSLHTLKGTSRSLSLLAMSDAGDAVDHLMHTIKTTSNRLRADELEILNALGDNCAETLERLNRGGESPDRFPAGFDELIERTRALDQRRRQAWQPEPADKVGAAISEPGVRPLESESLAQHRADAAAASSVDTHEAAAGTQHANRPAEIPLELRDEIIAVEGAEVATGLDLSDIFCEEALDILGRIDQQLSGCVAGANIESDVIGALNRELHTLKGSARAAGVDVIGDLSHSTETLLEAVERRRDFDWSGLPQLLEEVHDTLVNLVHRVERHQSLPDTSTLDRAVLTFIDSSRSGDQRDAATASATGAESLDVDRGDAGVAASVLDQATAGSAARSAKPVTLPTAAAFAPRERVRVDAGVLDQLFGCAGEVSVSRAQMEQQLGGLKTNLNELRANILRFSDQLRDLEIQAESQIRSGSEEKMAAAMDEEFDPLEFDRYTKLQHLSRSLSESLDDLTTIQGGLHGFTNEVESVLQQQSLLSSELQDGLMRTRMVPFSTLIPRLRHHVRQTARELNKQVELRVSGGEVEVDRNVLATMTEAFEHMIRNAVGHGIEESEQRSGCGKPELGTIHITCRQEGSEFVIRFNDDGAGLAFDKIRDKALETGLLKQDSSLSDQDLIQLIVTPGFTTVDRVTQLSGRGVGLDVVHSAVRRLGGNIGVESDPERGTTFEIRLPVTLSITHALFVRCGNQTFAVPFGVIHRVVKIDRDQLPGPSRDSGVTVSVAGQSYPLLDLVRRLGLELPGELSRRVPLLIVRMGARDIAVQVDDLLGAQEVVIRTLGAHLDNIQGIAGATVRGDGGVVLILDLAELWVAHEAVHWTPHGSQQAQFDSLPVIMVVDDSLTVRKVTSRNLSRHGMDVLMAKDGVDALEQMRQRQPDLLLVDIEMPRMDGYELTARVRTEENTRDIPIVIITSRAGVKHKQKAMELGADAYLTKPYQEQELVANVQALLPQFFARDQRAIH